MGYDINIFIDTRFKPYQRKSLAKLFPDYIYTSCHPRFNSRGVAIFVNSLLDFVYIDCEIDDQGNLITLHCQIYGKEFCIVGYYGPSSDSTFFYQRFSDAIKRAYQNCPNVMATGDFNIFFDRAMDSFGYPALPKPRGRNIINNLCLETNLFDAFRRLYPNDYTISWRKWNGLQGSRLDHVFLSQSLSDYLTEVEYIPPPIDTLDHCLLVTTLTFSTIPRGRGIFKVPFGLEEDDNYVRIFTRTVVNSIIDNYEFDAETSHILQNLNDDSPDLSRVASLFKPDKWRARPGSVLQEIINSAKDSARRYTKSVNAQLRRELLEIIKKLKIAYNDLILRESQATYDAFYQLQVEYREKINVVCQTKYGKNAKDTSIFGEKPTRFLFNSRSEKKQRKPIVKILTPDGTVLETKTEVQDALVNFWSGLYNSTDTQGLSVADFLGPEIRNLPQLTEMQKASLDRKITEPEVKAAVFSLRNGAAAGYDGVGASWFKKFYKILAPVLLATYQDAFDNGQVPEFFKYAIICLIPKSSNRTSVSNWRPISLLPTSYKILSTLAARRLKPVLSDIIGPDQKAYVPRRLLYDIHYNLFNEVNLAKKAGRRGNLIAVDYKKAFDSVHLSAIEETLRAFGFGPSFIGLAMMTLHGRSASLSINNELSESFPLRNGVPQGDAVAPYLFILLMEILLCKFRHDTYLSTLNPGSSIRVQSFADDLTLLLGYDLREVRYAIDLINQFSLVSGLCINLTKTQLLPILHDGFNDNELDGLTQVAQIKLLGLYFDSEFKPTDRNSDAKFNQLRARSFKWSSAHFNIDGRLIIAKSVMNSLFHNLGIIPGLNHPKLAWEVDKKINLYLWSGTHKVRTVDTRLPKKFGGFDCICSEEMWIASRVKALLRVFDCEERWAHDVREELLQFGIDGRETLLRKNILDLQILGRRLSNRLAAYLINDLADYQKLYFRNNPALILNEKVFRNFWGSIRLPDRLLHQDDTPVRLNLHLGLRAEFFPELDPDMTYFEFCNSYYTDRLVLNRSVTNYAAQFVRRVSKVLPPTALATYAPSETYYTRVKATSKLRRLLQPKEVIFDRDNYIFKRWEKKTGLFTPALAQEMVKNHTMKIEDSRISDFLVRLGTCTLGFRRILAKYKTVDPRCFLCQDQAARHDLFHIFYECQFARSARCDIQNHLFFPLEFNLSSISPVDFFVGLSPARAEQLGLSCKFVNQALLLIKYNIWTCSLNEIDDPSINKVNSMNRSSVAKLVRTGRL